MIAPPMRAFSKSDAVSTRYGIIAPVTESVDCGTVY